MPVRYEAIADLPPELVEPYDDQQKEAFRSAYNAALETFDGDEIRAIDIAHAAAKGTPGDR